MKAVISLLHTMLKFKLAPKSEIVALQVDDVLAQTSNYNQRKTLKRVRK